jgi:hypothetical protein
MNQYQFAIPTAGYAFNIREIDEVQDYLEKNYMWHAIEKQKKTEPDGMPIFHVAIKKNQMEKFNKEMIKRGLIF